MNYMTKTNLKLKLIVILGLIMYMASAINMFNISKFDPLTAVGLIVSTAIIVIYISIFDDKPPMTDDKIESNMDRIHIVCSRCDLHMILHYYRGIWIVQLITNEDDKIVDSSSTTGVQSAFSEAERMASHYRKINRLRTT